MLPQKHFLISGFFIAILAFILGLDIKTAVLWVLIGGFFSMIIDADSVILLAFTKNKRLARFKSIRAIFLNFDGLISELKKTGALRILTITHFMISILIIAISFFALYDYFVPILAGVVIHLLGDLWILGKS